MNATEHYDGHYFRMQSVNFSVQGRADLFKFVAFIGKDDRVLDFGCGSGGLLREISAHCRGVVGVEINPVAAEHARSLGVEIWHKLEDVESCSIDVLISNHALEHVEDPLQVLRQVYRVLRSGGKTVLVVPCDKPSLGWKEHDVDMHLFSWSANNIANLVRIAGFEVLEAREILHRWPPGWAFIERNLGLPVLHVASALWARIDRRRSQVRVVAKKPNESS
jgi:SAM-dependent methyltransferase